MKDHKDCPICQQELVSEIGKGCKMCGMPLENKNDDFCSLKCKEDYKNIHSKVKYGRKNIVLH